MTEISVLISRNSFHRWGSGGHERVFARAAGECRDEEPGLAFRMEGMQTPKQKSQIMWQLICHHTYKFDGYAIDVSPFYNDGDRTDTEYLKDGQSPGSGSLRFELQTARVVVKADDRWAGLGAVKIDAVARIDAGKNAMRVIALGDRSFAFGINADGYLYATVFGAAQICTSNAATAPDGRAHLVPTKRWRQLGMVYDGVGTLTLSIDGELVGRTVIATGLRNVTGRGLAIGNAHDHPEGGPLLGEIDEIRVWRYHPNSVIDEFCARPIDDATAACWEGLDETIRRALSQDPDCAQAVRLAVKGVIERASRAGVGTPPLVRQELADLLQRYLQLWESAQIAGPEMQVVVEKLVDLFRANGIDFAADQEIDAFIRSPCLRDILAGLSGFDCDREFTGLLRLIGAAQGLALPNAAPGGD